MHTWDSLISEKYFCVDFTNDFFFLEKFRYDRKRNRGSKW